jgi:hypothetical protein
MVAQKDAKPSNGKDGEHDKKMTSQFDNIIADLFQLAVSMF